MSNMTLALLVVILSCIGGATVGRWIIEAAIGLRQFIREAHRSYIQARRIERIEAGRHRRFGVVRFVHVWRTAFGWTFDLSALSPTRRMYVLPYDVRQPITRVW